MESMLRAVARMSLNPGDSPGSRHPAVDSWRKDGDGLERNTSGMQESQLPLGKILGELDSGSPSECASSPGGSNGLHQPDGSRPSGGPCIPSGLGGSNEPSSPSVTEEARWIDRFESQEAALPTQGARPTQEVGANRQSDIWPQEPQGPQNHIQRIC